MESGAYGSIADEQQNEEWWNYQNILLYYIGEYAAQEAEKREMWKYII